jgi:hypothetical protein
MTEANRTSFDGRQDADEPSTTTRLQADGGCRDGPHPTPGPLPPAGDDERTLFQAAVDGAICRVDPPGGRTGIEPRDRDPTGAVRVWVSGANHNPTPRVTIAVEDDREVVTITASAFPTANGLREWAASIRGESGGSETSYVDGGEVHVRSEGGGAEIWDETDDGSLSVTRLGRSDGITVGTGTGDSWASVRLVDDADRDELALAAETAAEVIDDE